MSDTVTDVKAYQRYAGGQWRDVSGGKLFDDFEPYTGNLYARVAECGVEEARLAITAAHEAFGPCRARVSFSVPGRSDGTAATAGQLDMFGLV